MPCLGFLTGECPGGLWNRHVPRTPDFVSLLPRHEFEAIAGYTPSNGSMVKWKNCLWTRILHTACCQTRFALGAATLRGSH